MIDNEQTHELAKGVVRAAYEKIGIIRGIRYSDIGTKGLNRTLTNDMSHLFTLLDKERIDVAIAVLEAGKIEVHKNFPKSGIHVIGRPLQSSPLFHFIHKRNQDLLPELESTLLMMKRSGEMEAIREETLQEMFSQ